MILLKTEILRTFFFRALIFCIPKLIIVFFFPSLLPTPPLLPLLFLSRNQTAIIPPLAPSPLPRNTLHTRSGRGQPDGVCRSRSRAPNRGRIIGNDIDVQAVERAAELVAALVQRHQEAGQLLAQIPVAGRLGHLQQPHALLAAAAAAVAFLERVQHEQVAARGLQHAFLEGGVEEGLGRGEMGE